MNEAKADCGKTWAAFVVLGLGMLPLVATSADEVSDSSWYGDWSIDLQSETPAWLRIERTPNGPEVRFRLHVGSDGRHSNVQVKDGQLQFTLKQNRKARDQKIVRLRVDGEQLTGELLTQGPYNKTTDPFVGHRIPAMPDSAPDLNRVRFEMPRAIFNGKDLNGWRPHESDKINGWSVQDGMLVNTTPKTDFSATGAYANLRTEEEFEDFWLHLEFLVEENRNSGVYLRGMYEAQVVDRDSRMQGIQGVGAIFGAIEPRINAGLPGGQWQTYDLTLVDRHVTVVLNGEKVIDNQPISAPTAGAVFTDPSKPGPLLLQGDHTNVKYRNLYIAPVVSSNE
ncbi:DUF1080 domain-containing protein [Rhodopirellula sp. JC740]|uniref:DUF1080 domain-containing protein n=1 Tax=Rhodopirellula halodulae TaxID=2894198 RepID=A0ABS8NJN6_9BACT|nr:DUF1080 domain-containing protein [Rhodopirellula sp. JC740]MCC9643599.1 DUF1080 domain-containing protein [Rhodopirellula sp. JC740]